MATTTNPRLKGGYFILGDTPAEELFVSEDLTEEQLMIANTVEEFCVKEIQDFFMSRGSELEVTNPDDKKIVLSILKKAGEIGLAGVAIPEAYGGMDVDFKTNTLFSAVISNGFSFATTLGAQVSIGSLPIVYYGTEEQKQKYLPGIATAEKVAAYALTEPGAGSDANGGRTSAKLNPEGTHYLINGQKIWITNGGFADVYIVFAKIDDDKNLSAFIVERDYEGFSVGPEEKKMGIKGSSTCQIYFDNCKVPVENLLGDRGIGFKMALNILNGGRLKAGAGSIGGSQLAMTKAIEYAVERRQFDTPISEFGAIQYKIGDVAARGFAGSAAMYRTADMIDRKIAEYKAEGMPSNEAKLNASREFAVEASIIKVEGSNLGCYAVDEALQIFGGMGYAVETGIEMGVRDARITKIYEGTNEINSMLAVGELTKRGVITKEIDLMGAGKKMPGYLFKSFFGMESGGKYSNEWRLVRGIKNTFLLVSGVAGQKLGKKLVDEQEMVMNFYTLLAEAYVAESALLKIEKLAARSGYDAKTLEVQTAAMQLYLYESRAKAWKGALEAILSFATGMQKNMLKRGVKLLLKPYDVNPKELRRQVARHVIDKKKCVV